MITTRFLAESEYPQYALWVKKLTPEIRSTYFGVAYTDEQIDRLVDGIVEKSDKHNFLVAEFKGEWIGSIHIAEVTEEEVEFGFIVDAEHRGHGIADRMMKEALLWSRNRGYHSLYMHCLSWNQPIKRLCIKHGMELHTEYGETETKLELPPPDFSTITEEVLTRNRQAYRMMLQTFNPFLNEVYS
jgi:RimJ/RimL family protein N-acetyltransferase